MNNHDSTNSAGNNGFSAIPLQHLASQELYPGYTAELEKKRHRDHMIAQANAEPLPGPLLEAFAGVPQTVGGLTVRSVVHYDFLLLRLLKSPILQHMVKGDAGDAGLKTEMLEEQVYDLCLLFTMPCREAAKIIETQGTEAFRQLSRDRVGLSLSPMHVALLLKAVEREFVRAFSTVVGLRATSGATESDGTQVFPQPPTNQRMGSAGGLNTSASSSKDSPDGLKNTSSLICPGSKAEPSTPGSPLSP